MPKVIDVPALEQELKKMVAAINDLNTKVTRLQSQVTALQNSQEHPKSN
jgi:hypothetical protein